MAMRSESCSPGNCSLGSQVPVPSLLCGMLGYPQVGHLNAGAMVNWLQKEPVDCSRRQVRYNPFEQNFAIPKTAIIVKTPKTDTWQGLTMLIHLSHYWSLVGLATSDRLVG